MFFCFAIISWICVIVSNADNLQQNVEGATKVQLGVSGLKSNGSQIETAAPNSMIEDAGEKKQLAISYDILPSKIFCGLQHWDDYYHTTDKGELTAVDEFPWILSLDNIPYCMGVLISSKYAIISSLCAKQRNMVIIGEHNWSKNVSCTKTPYGDDCTDAKKNITIEEHINLPGGELSLIRLAQRISYSDYIRPICLPIEDYEVPGNNDTVVATVWRSCVTNVSECTALSDEVYVKRKLHLRVKSSLNSTQEICTLPLRQDNSKGEYLLQSGISIMYKYKSNWFLSGIIAKRSANDRCGERITPEIVRAIAENMRK